MLTADSLAALRAFARERGVDLDGVDAATAVSLMSDWYAHERADDVDLSGDGDMLLFEWGTYPWDGVSFRYSLTRQFIVGGRADDDDAFWQLKCCLHYPSSADADALGSGTQWCDSPGGLDDFRAFIESAIATPFARSESAFRVELTLLPSA